MGWNRPLTNTFQSLFVKLGPGCRHSFNEGAALWALAEASYTTLIFVVSAQDHMTGL